MEVEAYRQRGAQCSIRRLGLVEYEDGLDLQSQLSAARKDGVVPDTLLLLEHPHVITIGRRARHLSEPLAEQIHAQPDQLGRLGVDVFEADRGGAVTYHGPGQLVAYPILKLTGRRCDAHRYLRDLEETLIRTLTDFDIRAARVPGRTGVWVGGEKIASIGVHISRWVTRHGLALNVNTNLSFFDLIAPCGLKGIRMTSMDKILGSPIPIEQVGARMIHHFGRVFEVQMSEQAVDHDSVQVVVRVLDDDAYLLLKRNPSNGGFWQPVTGYVEPGESLSDAARREVEEETGIHIPTSALIRLPYVHCFAIARSLLSHPSGGPVVMREHSFALPLEKRPLNIRLDAREHEDWALTGYATASSLVAWKGNRRAIALTDQLCQRPSWEAGHGSTGSGYATPR